MSNIHLHPAVFDHKHQGYNTIVRSLERDTGMAVLVVVGKACLVPKPTGLTRRDDWTPPESAA